jgi:pyridoxamine 5'-phosphate oxidase
MDKNDMLRLLAELIDESKVGLLATVDAHGRPHMRWMVPALLRGRSGVLYTVSAPDAPKVAQIEAHPDVEWIIQTRAVHRILTLRGRMYAVDNPSLRSMVLETMGRRLTAFWKQATNPSAFVVLETVLEEATYYLPMKGVRFTVPFAE